jgi:ligand-binding sensor domain-containing protein
MIKTLIFLIAFFVAGYSMAQELLGTPKIVNYTNEVYKGGIQNWDVKQDRGGILYFGNNEGLLTFDGRYWNLHRLPNFTAVRSLGIDSRNRIYVGGQDEFGYFFPDAQGILRYHSLLYLLPEDLRKLADIWDISIVKDEVFFRSNNAVLHYKNDVVKYYKTATTWLHLGEANGKIFAQVREKGLLQFDQGIWTPYCADTVLKQASVTSIMPFGRHSILISTLKRGLFIISKGKLTSFKTKFDPVLFNDRIFFASQISSGQYAIGTTSGGIYIMNRVGQVVQKYNYREGLQNNNVRGILLDKHKNVWLALDDGISYIAINSAIKNIFPDRTKQITSYAFRKHNQSIYIGTSNGLYCSAITGNSADISYSVSNFQEVKNTKGQVWGLNEFNNQLLMAHEEGTFLINNNVAVPMYSLPGTWMFESLENIIPITDVIAGTYTGLQKLAYSNGRFSNMGKVEGIKETLRFIVADNNNPDLIWASHPYHGVYKILLKPDHKSILTVKMFTDVDGLPFKLYNYVYRIKNRVVVATAKGVYEFDSNKNRFVRVSLFGKLLDDTPIQYLKEDNDGNVWFVSNKKVGVIDFSKPSGKNNFSIFYMPELDGKVVGGFESIYALDDKNIFIGANKGAYHINYSKYIRNITRPNIVLGAVKLQGKSDSLVFGGYFVKNNAIAERQDVSHIPSFNNELNSIHFEFSSTLFEQDKNLTFSYQLVGFDDHWSVWSDKSEKDYTNLPAGCYTFNVKARSHINNESKVLSYVFEVKHAWYDTWWMKIIYIFLTALAIKVLIKWQKAKHQKAQHRMSYLHQLELDRNEKEIIRLQNEKLEAEVNYKNKELSTMTMHLLQRGKVLAKIKEVISAVVKNHDITDSSTSFRHLIRLIKDVERKDQELDHLSVHFSHVNTDFFNKLKSRYPELSQNDLKFCAYLSMNLSTKEMAQLMNVTIKAVEVGRYRLRKKLQLKPETNLYEFLNEISKTKMI